MKVTLQNTTYIGTYGTIFHQKKSTSCHFQSKQKPYSVVNFLNGFAQKGDLYIGKGVNTAFVVIAIVWTQYKHTQA